jgi:hypothetical protein
VSTIRVRRGCLGHLERVQLVEEEHRCWDCKGVGGPCDGCLSGVVDEG